MLGERKKRGLPYITSMIMLIDPQIGTFTAIMDGALITNWRTGAQTAVALKYLHDNKSIRIGLYGAGMQGHTQTLAIANCSTSKKSKFMISIQRLLKNTNMTCRGIVKGAITIVDTPEKAACGDAVICVTQSKDKFIRDHWIQPGTVVFPMDRIRSVKTNLFSTRTGLSLITSSNAFIGAS